MTDLCAKYRPQDFGDVIGQTTTVRSLRRALETKRSKAFLFTGPPGTGKTTLARIVVATMGGNGTSASKIEIDAATNSGADSMREVIQKAQFKAIGGCPTKVIILDEAHRLSAAAWTILLKPVEEPPAHVYWVFCSTEPGKIPEAIVTRCLRYDLKAVSPDNLFELLVRVVEAEKLGVSDEILEAIAEGSRGSPRQALTNLEICLSCKSGQQARVLLRDAGQSKEVADLCKFLLDGRAQTWAEAARIIKAFEGQDGESVRIAVVGYLSKVALNTKDNARAAKVLGMLECFGNTYNQSDRLAPLMVSVAQAIGQAQ